MLATSIPHATLETTAREQGRMARYQGVPLRRNPYEDGTASYRGWRQGWDEASEEVVLLNLAAVVQEVVEGIKEQEPGIYEIDPGLIHVLRHASDQAKGYV